MESWQWICRSDIIHVCIYVWPVCADVFEHPPPWLASWHSVWSDMTSVDTVTQWREDWSSASVVNHTTVTDPTIQQPGFDFPRHTWSLMNRCCTGQGPCHANLHKGDLAQSPSTSSTRAREQNLKTDWIYSTKRMMAGIYTNCSSC